MNRLTTLLLLALTVAAPLSACGDDSADTTPGSSTLSNTEFCALAEQVVTTQTQIDTQLDGTGLPAELEGTFTAYLTLLDDLKAAAPTALQADVATARTAFEAFDAALRAIDYDIGRAAADPALGEAMAAQLQVMRSTEVTTAMSNVDTYAVETCGFSLQSDS